MKTLSYYVTRKLAKMRKTQQELSVKYEAERKAFKEARQVFEATEDDTALLELRAKSKVSYAARMANDNAIDAFIRKHSKAPVIPQELRRTFTLDVVYPRDGMGRLKMHGSNDVTVWASGCGYDKRGKVLGNWIQETFRAQLDELNQFHIDRFYGMDSFNGRPITLDGACGENCMVDILNWLGFTVTYTLDRKRRYITSYTITYVGA